MPVIVFHRYPRGSWLVRTVLAKIPSPDPSTDESAWMVISFAVRGIHTLKSRNRTSESTVTCTGMPSWSSSTDPCVVNTTWNTPSVASFSPADDVEMYMRSPSRPDRADLSMSRRPGDEGRECQAEPPGTVSTVSLGASPPPVTQRDVNDRSVP